jgi:threonine/homoserine/homoserine lactone efflux protein
MMCAAFGITALVFAVPYAYDALRFFRPGGPPFRVQSLPADSSVKLFTMGFVTNLLNPKIAMLISRCCRNSSIRSW